MMTSQTERRVYTSTALMLLLVNYHWCTGARSVTPNHALEGARRTASSSLAGCVPARPSA
jgi:hypothetical protein